LRELGPGDEIGGYLIEGLAGRGGMGLVYRARQRRPDRVVAIKVIAPELAADPVFRSRFEHESAIAAEIEHPNVIPVYEVGEHQDRLFIVMRFVQGVDLGQLVKQDGRLEPRRVARLVLQVAGALDAAHARGLVHRDVKPGNVLVAPGDQVYLTDFGLTKRMSDAQGMTQTGMFVGTVDYIAPEQVEGRPLDARADVYALGCVTYELLAGEVPFPRDSELAKIFAHVNDPPPRLQEVPAPLADAVARAMAKAPADRFSSAGDFGRAVEAGVDGRSQPGAERTVASRAAALRDAPTAYTGAPAPTASPPARRRSGRWLVAGLAALLAVAGVAVGVVLAVSSGGSSTTTGTAATGTSPLVTPQPTQAKIYSPTNANGDLAVTVTSRVTGTCFSTSNIVERPDAYRCSVGNTLYDPCFAVGATAALCPAGGPWSNSGILVRAAPPSGPQNPDQGTKGPPWAVELASGPRCLELSGAVQVVAGQPLRYGCGGGVGLYGDVRRSGPVWVIYEGTAHSATLELKPISVAWF
jgi:predicted Ser/Thr protein kinase